MSTSPSVDQRLPRQEGRHLLSDKKELRQHHRRGGQQGSGITYGDRLVLAPDAGELREARRRLERSQGELTSQRHVRHLAGREICGRPIPLAATGASTMPLHTISPVMTRPSPQAQDHRRSSATSCSRPTSIQASPPPRRTVSSSSSAPTAACSASANATPTHGWPRPASKRRAPTRWGCRSATC